MANHKVPQDPTLPQGFNLTFRTRFWKHVIKNGPIPAHRPWLGECWLWTGQQTVNGRGQIFKNLTDHQIETHRASWIIHYGPIPDGLCVCHKCDVPLCVRPDHLWLGTHAENLTDMADKDRSNHGERHPLHKLTNEDIPEIRRLYATGRFRMKDIAVQFHVVPQTICDIVIRKTWRRIP